MEKQAARRVHQHIQHVDSDVLHWAGISPELLARGPAAYPWRIEPASEAGPTVQSVVSATVTQLHGNDELAIRRAIAELRACTDAELADMGIARGEIAQVVRYGRPGIERPSFDESRQTAA